MAKIIKKRFPKKELNACLREHRSWDHSEWIDLLDNLSNQGFHEWCFWRRAKGNWVLFGN